MSHAPAESKGWPAQRGGNLITIDERVGLVIHVTNGGDDDLRTALRYATNFNIAAEGGRPVDIVVNGAALSLVLAESAWRSSVSELQAAGSVTFSACANTMAARGVQAADLHPAAHVVPAAVLHVAERQWAGWAYLRP